MYQMCSLRSVLNPNCNCRLFPPRHGLSLDARMREKRVACGHEPHSIPIFPPAFCFCNNYEKRNSQVALADPEPNNRDYLEEDSDSIEHEEDNFVDRDSTHSNDTQVHCFREFRRM